MSEEESGKERRQLLKQAFQLAYFILPERTAALEVLAGALERLQLQCGRERKRVYWRNQRLVKRIRRIIRHDRDLLQWLVYLESDRIERLQEGTHQCTTTDMIIRYAKHVVQLTTAMSSFYVNIGLNRLLYNYGTSEVRHTYESVTDLYPGAYQYRKVKGKLMSELLDRFGNFIQTRKSPYGEHTFDTYADQSVWGDLIEECLERFTPWSTKRACLSTDSPWARLSGKRPTEHFRRNVQENILEISRCHWFIHPPCFGELARGLELPPRRNKLAVPRFFFKNEQGSSGPWQILERNTSPLTDSEYLALENRLADADKRRQQIVPEELKIRAHGVEYARLNLAAEGIATFEIHGGINLIEFWTTDAQRELLLATHWVDYSKFGDFVSGKYAIAILPKKELQLRIVPIETELENAARARVSIQSARKRLPFPLTNFIPSLSSGSLALAGCALSLSLLLIMGVTLSKYRREEAKERLLVERTTKDLELARNALKERNGTTLPSSNRLATYLLTPDDDVDRSGPGPDESVIILGGSSSLINLQLPVGSTEPNSYRATLRAFDGNRELLRETSLKGRKQGDRLLVDFILPSPLVETNRRYVIDLESINRNGGADIVGSFTFTTKRQAN